MTRLTLLELTGILRALSHPIRLEIVKKLTNNESSVTELKWYLHRKQSNVSQHLRVLREKGLVSSKKKGKQQIYVLNEKYTDLIRYVCKYKV